MKSQMTIGKKLFTCFGALLALTAAISIYALVSITSLGDKMGTLVNLNSKRQYVASQLEGATFELLGFERGILLRAYMNDRPVMEQYNEGRRVAAERTRKALSDFALLSEDPQEKQLISEAESNMDKADAFHTQLWQQATSGKIDAAVVLYRDKLNPEVKKVTDYSKKLADEQGPIMAKAYTDASGSVSWSKWIMFCVLGFCLASTAVSVWVVRNISDSLRKVVTELSNGGDQVASASSQIASTSQSLSQGSSEQAASLEEISASMEEMTAMAKRNTENSGQATGMMNETATQVERSNVALREMVVSMSAIKTSSEKVAKIIKTIEEIAFQTNILALNAAVEAARAGEAGMGFAVVADEVRNLAQRSAVAAKDTAGLIDEAVSNSSQGAEKLDQVAVCIRAITESANKVKGLVEEVSESSKQTTIGINQTSTAVTQVSKVTQTAAASAQESAAASQELSAQAQTVRDLVLSLSGMVDGGSTGHTTPRAIRSNPLLPVRQRVALAKPVVKTAPAVVLHSDEDPFPMDTAETGSFRSF